jgi:glutamate synthase (NADPH/NADH) small chain
MPGNARDRALAREEGVAFEWLTQPVRFLGDATGNVTAVECTRMRLAEADDSGRRRPIPIEGSEFTTTVDTVILALGFRADPLIGEATPGLETHRGGLIVANESTGATTLPGVFAGGDDVAGPDLVVTAVAHGRRAAEAIHEKLMQRRGSSSRHPAGNSYY